MPSQDRGWIPRRARCIPPPSTANSKNECGRQGEKFIESRPPVLPPKAFPVNRCAAVFSNGSLQKLSLPPSFVWMSHGPATFPLLPPLPLHESLKVHREAGNRRCLLLFRRGSACRQLEARVWKVDELFCIYPVRWLGGILVVLREFRIVVRSSQDMLLEERTMILVYNSLS